MVIKCEDVWREISNYLEGDLDLDPKRAMDEHFAQCRECKAVLEGTRNVIDLYGDERMFHLPTRFSPRLRHRLISEIEPQRGSARGWWVGIAAAAALAALVFGATLRNRLVPEPSAQMSQPTRQLPQRLVAIVEGGKTFHVPGCEFMHGRYRLVTPEEAVREGYTPCPRCMPGALRSAGNTTTPAADEDELVSVEAGKK
jgi:hypothetical protein